MFGLLAASTFVIYHADDEGQHAPGGAPAQFVSS